MYHGRIPTLEKRTLKNSAATGGRRLSIRSGKSTFSCPKRSSGFSSLSATSSFASNSLSFSGTFLPQPGQTVSPFLISVLQNAQIFFTLIRITSVLQKGQIWSSSSISRPQCLQIMLSILSEELFALLFASSTLLFYLPFSLRFSTLLFFLYSTLLFYTSINSADKKGWKVPFPSSLIENILIPSPIRKRLSSLRQKTQNTNEDIDDIHIEL